MILILYNLLLPLYVLAIRIYGLFNGKAKKWTEGRKDWESNMRTALKPGEKRIWLHCSSVGEFEQARPIITALQAQYPAYKIVITFFSPSGYEVWKNSKELDYVFYLPMDSRQHAERFIDIVAPSLVIFIKYEFWYYYLAQLRKKGIPTLLVSGVFRKGQAFFTWYGGFFRRMLDGFTFFFLQDEESRKLLNAIGLDKNVIVSGDTRYDRVAVIAQAPLPIPAIDQFAATNRLLIAGSTWPGDEAVLQDCLPLLPTDWKLIIAPHEVDKEHINRLRRQLGNDVTILFSELTTANDGGDKKILIIDNIGMLSRLFAYGDVAFIGGGFQKGGIHNILEPAVFGLPVIFGPVYDKYVEAKQLAALHLVFPVNNAAETKDALQRLVIDQQYRNEVSVSLKKFMREQTGATNVVLQGIDKKRWLS